MVCRFRFILTLLFLTLIHNSLHHYCFTIRALKLICIKFSKLHVCDTHLSCSSTLTGNSHRCFWQENLKKWHLYFILHTKLNEMNTKGDNSSYFKGICLLRIHLYRGHNYNYTPVHALLLAQHLWQIMFVRVPIPVAARLKAWVCGRSIARLRIPPEAWMSVSCECCVLSEVSASGGSLVQKNST
jgi:hypothetical protein